jgi:hypothetical protein
MADDTWTDYLEAASEHLRATRLSVELGRASPEPPEPPEGSVPDELSPRVRRLVLAYDQLALEVATRLEDMTGHLAPPRVEPPSLPHYVDRKA